MGIDGVGSSVVVALAAVLWFVYLVPTWFKRREYLATERNAVRLQQTMRIMAESAEMPDVVRVEANARAVAAQERALRKHAKLTRARDADPRRLSSAHSARIETASPTLGSASAADSRRLSSAHSARIETASRSASRLRRSRALASVILLAALVGTGVGVSTLVVDGSWVLLAASAVVGFGAVALLRQAAAVARTRSSQRAAVTLAPSDLHDHADYAPRPVAEWTPVAVPRPLYLSRADAGRQIAAVQEVRRLSGPQGVRIETAAATRDIDHAAALRAASAEAERALREAQMAPGVERFTRPAATAQPSRFASMGVIASADAAPADLDDILRRRRAVG